MTKDTLILANAIDTKIDRLRAILDKIGQPSYSIEHGMRLFMHIPNLLQNGLSVSMEDLGLQKFLIQQMVDYCKKEIPFLTEQLRTL